MIVVKILQALFISLSDPSEVVIIILSGRFEASPNGHVILRSWRFDAEMSGLP